MNDRRELTVPSALLAHQLRQWLKTKGIDIEASRPGARGTETILTITAAPDQWAEIQRWLERAT